MGSSTHSVARGAWEDFERRLEAVFEGSGNPMVLFDDELRLLAANAPTSEFLLTPHEDILKRTIYDFSPPEEVARVPGLLQELLDEGHVEGAYEALLPDGSRRRIEFSAVANITPGRHLGLVHPGWEDAGARDGGKAQGDEAENASGERSLRPDLPKGIGAPRLHPHGRLVAPYVDTAAERIACDLTPREQEILEAIAMGVTGRRIAELLGISYETVRAHIRNVLLKLGARTQAHAIALALKRGLIRLPP